MERLIGDNGSYTQINRFYVRCYYQGIDKRAPNRFASEKRAREWADRYEELNPSCKTRVEKVSKMYKDHY
jgi:arginyl-tRNA synthetase